MTFAGSTVDTMSNEAARQLLTANLARFAREFSTVTTLRLDISNNQESEENEWRRETPGEEPLFPSELLSMFGATCPNLQHLILQGRFNRVILQEYGKSSELKKLEIDPINAHILGNLSEDMPGIATLEFYALYNNELEQKLKRALRVMVAGIKLVHLNLGEDGIVTGDTWTFIPSTIMTLKTDIDWDFRAESTRHAIRQKLEPDYVSEIPAQLSLPNLTELHWNGTITEVRDLLKAAPNLRIMKGAVNSTCNPNMLSAWVDLAKRMNDGLKGVEVVLHIERHNGPTSDLQRFMGQMPCLPYISKLSVCSRKNPVPKNGEQNMFDIINDVFPNIQVLHGYNLYFDDEALHALMNCSSMREICFQSCQYMTAVGIVMLASHHIALKVVILTDCGGVEYNPSNTKVLAQFGGGTTIEIADLNEW